MRIAAIVLIVVGVLLMIFTGVKYFTKEKVVDIGKIEINREKPHWVSWSPFVGAALVVAGGVMYFVGAKKNA
ncbi:MAG: hypothetical protein U0V74_07705 [Chitinophagales bacterium]